MASTFTSVCPTVIQASANSGHRKTSSSAASWWTPVFGFSSEPDYIDSNSSDKNSSDPTEKSKSDAVEVSKSRPAKRFAGCFTEDKARQLRMMTVETETFHDTMYHSAIASRLASDFKTRSDQ